MNLTFFLAASLAFAGPIEFAQSELRAAMAEKGVLLNITTEINLDPPETFHITAVNAGGARISGGDLRGLMYGMIEAAEQIRGVGKLAITNGEPGLRLRAIRIAPLDTDLAAPGFYGTDRWTNFFKMLAKNRINRVTLVLPPDKLELDRLHIVSLLARDFAVDFFVGIRLPGPMTTPLQGQIRRLLDQVVLIRGLQFEIGRDPVDSYRAILFPALLASGRRVTLDLRNVDARQDVLRAAIAAGVVLDTAARSSTTALGQSYHAVIPSSSVAPDIDPVRARLATLAGADGFEIDLAGTNIEGYERIYWAWGRQGYNFRAPTIGAGKAQPKAKAKK